MALKSTVYKAKLEVVDLDRHYYATHDLTLACHPSETERRLLVRLVAFALNAHERLSFGKGVSDSEEPDLWLKDLEGQIDLWIELGHPEDRTLTRACGRSRRVVVYTYSANPHLWWDGLEARASRWKNLKVVSFDAEDCADLEVLAQDRTLEVQVTIQDGEVWVRGGDGVEVRLVPTVLKD
jgi:uncharacterized protein YaeQ